MPRTPERQDSGPVHAFKSELLAESDRSARTYDYVTAVQESKRSSTKGIMSTIGDFFRRKNRSESRERLNGIRTSEQRSNATTAHQEQEQVRGRPTVSNGHSRQVHKPQASYSKLPQILTAKNGEQSRTMQYAVALNNSTSPSGRANKSEYLTPPRPTVLARPASGPEPSLSINTTNALTPPNLPPRASSTPPSPTVTSFTYLSDDGTKMQCSGTTKAGERCKRFVKIDQLPLGRIHPGAVEETVGNVFCHSHRTRLVQGNDKANLAGKNVVFKEFIPDYLSLDTKAQLRVEMLKSISGADEKGYIYTFEIEDSKLPNSRLFKIGRTNNLERRMAEWSKQCPSQEQIPLDYYPRPDGGSTALLKGYIKAGKPGPNVHRLETLIHLELADLVVNKQYLDARYPDMRVSMPMVDINKPRSKSAKVKRTICDSCNSEHREIFAFSPFTEARLKNKEFEKIVKPVIERWGRFVATYYSN